jgi:hypothetical protein
MLFMGSAKYPNENDYDDFITRNGGSCNAYTELVRCGAAVGFAVGWESPVLFAFRGHSFSG